jgi:glycosyltransferase involved in cell wall biosynthesis
VARFWPEKAHDVLLEAFQIILADRPQAKLWMLGIGPHMAEFQVMAARMGLGDRAVFLGFRTDLAEVLALADLQIHPSDMEGVPLAICQGMAQGLPVVATSVGGLTEVIESGVSGILVEKRNPRQCARAVIELMDDAYRRQELGKAAARFIAEEYSLAAATRKVEQVYIDLISRSNSLNTRPKDASGS